MNNSTQKFRKATKVAMRDALRQEEIKTYFLQRVNGELGDNKSVEFFSKVFDDAWSNKGKHKGLLKFDDIIDQYLIEEDQNAEWIKEYAEANNISFEEAERVHKGEAYVVVSFLGVNLAEDQIWTKAKLKSCDLVTAFSFMNEGKEFHAGRFRKEYGRADVKYSVSHKFKKGITKQDLINFGFNEYAITEGNGEWLVDIV